MDGIKGCSILGCHSRAVTSLDWFPLCLTDFVHACSKVLQEAEGSLGNKDGILIVEMQAMEVRRKTGDLLASYELNVDRRRELLAVYAKALRLLNRVWHLRAENTRLAV